MGINVGMVALGAGAAGVAGFGMKHLYDGEVRDQDARLTLIQGELAAATADWSAWKAGVEAEFPGMKLDTPADHARFSEHLAAHPAPSWVDVEHESTTRVKTSTHQLAMHSDAAGPVQAEIVPYSIGFGGMGAALGAGMVAVSATNFITNPIARIATTLAGGAIAAAGVGLLAQGVMVGSKTGDEYDQSWSLNEDVNDPL